MNEVSTINNKDFFGKEFDKNDFVVPRVTIGQPLSKKGKPGHFNYNNGQSLEKLEGCRLIVPKKTRVLYGDGFDQPSLCGSDNFYYASKRYDKPQSSSCADCTLKDWGTNDAKERLFAGFKDSKTKAKGTEKPLCTEMYTLFMADNSMSPFIIQFAKTQLKVVSEKLFSRLTNEFANVSAPNVAFDMRLENPDSYYSVVFENFRVEESDVAVALHLQFKGQAEDIVAEQHDAMDAEKGSDEPPF